MTKKESTPEERKAFRQEQLQRKIAKEWKDFRHRFTFSQKQLAEHLGISRRTVQYVESGKGQNPNWPCIPVPETLAKFKVLKAKFEKEAE